MPAKYLLSTCRGREMHLREALPTWLERMPTWTPVVVCCDDPRAAEYCCDEMERTGRGIAIVVTQGPEFNRLEAIRAGVRVLSSGVLALDRPRGAMLISFADHDWPIVTRQDDSVVAIFDADTIATRQSERVFGAIFPDEVAISGTNIRDDFGLLVASLGVLRRAIDVIEPASFRGYGPEDCALRAAVWYANRRTFRRLTDGWTRRQHRNDLRTRYYPDGLRATAGRNNVALGELVAKLVDPQDIGMLAADCGIRHLLGDPCAAN